MHGYRKGAWGITKNCLVGIGISAGRAGRQETQLDKKLVRPGRQKPLLGWMQPGKQRLAPRTFAEEQTPAGPPQLKSNRMD